VFLANLELGYMMPPVGMNLLLASYRLKKPVTVIYRAALPMILVLLVGVLVITYVPAMTTWLPRLFGPGPGAEPRRARSLPLTDRRTGVSAGMNLLPILLARSSRSVAPRDPSPIRDGRLTRRAREIAALVEEGTEVGRRSLRQGRS
jgi:hypothetical protein